jgi:hypothetical protein
MTGIGWFPGDAALLFLHDLEGEASADSWESWPDRFAQVGYAVLAVDLPEKVSSIHIRGASVEIRRQVGGRVFIVAAGETVTLLDETMADGFVLIAPRGGALDPLALGVTPKLILAGTANASDFATAERFARRCRGWALLSTFAAENSMAALLGGRHALQIGSQIAGFLQEFRAPSSAQLPGTARQRPK